MPTIMIMTIMKKFLFKIFLLILMTQFTLSGLHSESYEDFLDQRDSANRTRFVSTDSNPPQRIERPLADIREGERSSFLEDLRGAVRDEIDATIGIERKPAVNETTIDEDRLIRDVRRIVKEEIEDAIRIKEMRYGSSGTFEAGVSFASEFEIFSSTNFKNSRLQVQPLINYFLLDGFGLSLKGGAGLSVTDLAENWNLGIGPIFTFGLNRSDTMHFFTGIYAGITSIKEDRRGSDSKYGLRYSNEFGVKFELARGILLSTSVMMGFDFINGSSRDNFKSSVMPMVGITAWF